MLHFGYRMVSYENNAVYILCISRLFIRKHNVEVDKRRLVILILTRFCMRTFVEFGFIVMRCMNETWLLI